ncbi:MAG: hypothetical protein LBD13_03315 [Spirochaetaceae bacterium]|jgi:hypothetical protein|nr:hypothetical protein [Spirochaetaceae bacterium]
MIRADHMILIGSSGRNAGKTTLAAALINRWKGLFPIAALKITSIANRSHQCPRGGEGCGACSSLGAAPFVLEEEAPQAGSEKDTARLLHAGADQAFWLRSLFGALEEGYRAFLEKAPPDALVICESNSLREAVAPACFIMVRNSGETEMKPAAARVAALADITVQSALTDDFSRLFDRLTVERDGAALRVRVRPQER